MNLGLETEFNKMLKRVQAEIKKKLKVKTGTSQSKNSGEIISKMNQDNMYISSWNIEGKLLELN